MDNETTTESLDFMQFSELLANLGVRLCQSILDGESKDTVLETSKVLDEASYYLHEWFQHCSRHRLLIPQAWMVIFTSTNTCFVYIGEMWRDALPPGENENLLTLNPQFKSQLTNLMHSLKSESMNVDLLNKLSGDNPITISDLIQ